MDFRLKEKKSNPPINLPTIEENSRSSNNEDFLLNEEKERDKEEDIKKDKDFNLAFLGEEEIRLPKFVEEKGESKELERKEQYRKSSWHPSLNRKKYYLFLLVIIFMLILVYGGIYFWKNKNFLKNNQKKKNMVIEENNVDFTKFDEDKDGLSNLEELKYGTDPQNPDSDYDGIPDGWEVKYKLNPLDYVDALNDSDEDGLINLEEYRYGTNPQNSDTDGDNYKDGEEVENGYNPSGSGKLLSK